MITVHPHRPCLGSGQCCKTAPCALAVWRGFTEPDPERPGRPRCTKLEYDGVRYRCGAFLEDASVSPEIGGIGSGCCQPLFNTARERLARGLPAEVREDD